MTKGYVITGAPGTGKSSIIKELEKRGYSCSHEISREIITKETLNNGSILPWKNLNAFSLKIFSLRLKQFKKAPINKLHFFDRSVFDVLAYMQLKKIDTGALTTQTKNIKYNQTVFYTPIWHDIYTKDSERKESITLAKKIEKQILLIYKEHNYRMIKIPKSSIKERTDFILSQI